jgi:hypothetical protein
MKETFYITTRFIIRVTSCTSAIPIPPWRGRHGRYKRLRGFDVMS